MRLSIAVVGRMKAGPERDLAERYLDRARLTGRQIGLTGFDVLETPESRAGSADRRKLEEARALQALVPDSLIIGLDERGKNVDSENFASWIGDWRDAGKPSLSFLIGGADGLSPQLRDSADRLLSFSALTWPHQLVRIMLAEQLYRATTILNGHPYHRGG